ncbi:hypothetical protein CHL76_12055 [Marinococcus halophilus]|uniref:Uncharacterized protein n=1 Tax=Marinococcus halophilus TaxID=1371 RepID=A0A510Y9Q7_MARHA|nr:hypothetical protein [Marinococcus halophilus]OZT79639.1 hypothetical protein CHL76_12055 [Marinococcus halophilus]GEK59421.1 hypothetical protein MHA01_23260 [Marinococcus halophilus]
MSRQEFGFIQEMGETDVVVVVEKQEMVIPLEAKDMGLLQQMMVETDMEYVLVDLDEKQLIFDSDVMEGEANNPALKDLDVGVDDDGYVR